MEPPLISVVIPTCGRVVLLARCLDALREQTLPAESVDVIVVDDSPSPQLSAAVAACCDCAIAQGLALRRLRNPGPRGPAAARNVGWRAARAAWVAFTDDDTIAQSDWLARACAAFRPASGVPAPDAIWGGVKIPLPKKPTDYEQDSGRLQFAGFVTANAFCRRTLLARIGGFDERFALAWREDTDLYFRLCEAGACVRFVPDAVVLHPVRPARWYVCLAQQRKIQFDALLYKKHPRRYRQQVRRAPRWDYYVAVTTMAGSATMLLSGQPAPASGALLIWMLLTGAFFRLRLQDTSRAMQDVAALLLTSALIPPLAVFWRAVGVVRFRVLFL